MTSYISLGYMDVALAGSLLCINAALSFALNLGLSKRMFIAGTRMVVQLLLVGLVLKALFVSVSPWMTALAAVVMIGFAGYEARARQEKRFIGFWSWGLGAGSMAFAALVVTIFALSTAIRPEPWYHPQYAIPLLGMILGNAMTGVALGLERFLSVTDRERRAIEARLLCGATIQTALQGPVREAVRAGMIPIINAMASAGLVSLPGMMTGQILAGVEPFEAVKYQLLIMFLIGGGTTLGLVVAVLGASRLLTDDRHRLRLDRVYTQK
ncbi:MAG: iron export ABC transporter permease subunit FetB [Rhodospirillales bacterium]|jgi:putative ABC transport system permease protein|nr:iron export ABC transporter permease subunit FetB [Rhodospirillales bacterium]MBT4041019.1 iron export ABC transporter permease subunit FetB [Rhodospirillales bacterium]MBT4626011.1 iron export ABC transporter permease subunit FetB [Rhodospirillales bacterium]MBT5350294.1 iron export ABC transporter permease subunit FetB [Rhodospirillales bacterium]MBT5520287.1 iron export ABC transporter permease subunit FetB [Rhodospirillales bacterium]